MYVYSVSNASDDIFELVTSELRKIEISRKVLDSVIKKKYPNYDASTITNIQRYKIGSILQVLQEMVSKFQKTDLKHF